MQIKCPNCGETIHSEHINIQKTLAMCPACDHVFDFSKLIPHPKQKLRKTTQPERLRVIDGEGFVEMSFRGVLSPQERTLAALWIFLLVFFTFAFTAITIDKGGFVPPLIMFIPVILGLLYSLALTVANTTRARVDADSLLVEEKPIPLFDPSQGPLPRIKRLALSQHEIDRVFYEETADSQKSGRLKRYFNIYAQRTDGSRVLLMNGLPQEYAFYITYELDIGSRDLDENPDIQIEEITAEQEVIEAQADVNKIQHNW